MYNAFIIATYFLAELLCCLVLIHIWIKNYYVRNPSTKTLAGKFLFFVLAQLLVGFLIAFCERQRLYIFPLLELWPE